MISWFSKKQSCVALSTAEVEYVAALLASSEAVWMRNLLSNLFDLQLDDTCIYCDKKSCVKLLENLVFHDKSKHIEIKYHYIKDMVQRGVVKLHFVIQIDISLKGSSSIVGETGCMSIKYWRSS